MVEQDTIKLLRECDAGAKMGIASIDDVLDHVEDKKLYQKLADCKAEHEQLQCRIQQLLGKYKDTGNVLDENQHEAGHGGNGWHHCGSND